MTLIDKLEKSKNEQWSVRLKTDHPDGDSLDGIVLQIRPKYAVLCSIEDFENNGLLVVPRKRIKKVRDGKYETCLNAVLRNNGMTKSCQLPPWLEPCENLREVIEAMAEQKVWPGVEIVDGARSAYFIGPISSAGKKRLEIECYDAKGKWEDIYELKLSKIFKIQWQDRYTSHFNRYMQSQRDETSD